MIGWGILRGVTYALLLSTGAAAPGHRRHSRRADGVEPEEAAPTPPSELAASLLWLNDRRQKVPDVESVDVGEAEDFSGYDPEKAFVVRGCGMLWMGIDGTSQQRTGREEIVLNLGGYEQAPKRGEFATYLELYGGESGPRVELLHLMDWFEHTVRKRQAELGVPERERTHLYDIPVILGDNCSSNRGEFGGLVTMMDGVARKTRPTRVRRSTPVGPWRRSRTRFTCGTWPWRWTSFRHRTSPLWSRRA